MAEFNAYLKFNGNCKEAMQFYQGCLGGDLKMTTVGQSPMAKQMPEMRDRIMHSVLTNGTIMLMGSDSFGTEEYKRCNTLGLCLICQSKKEIETLFSKLSAGASDIHPLAKVFFGTYGDLTDKYGFNWMFQFNEEK